MSVPYNKMVKAQLLDLLIKRDARINELEVELAQRRGDAVRHAHRDRIDHALRREAARRICEATGQRSATLEQIETYLAAAAAQ